MTNLTVVIMALTDRGRVEVVKSMPLICESKIKGGVSQCSLQIKSWRLLERYHHVGVFSAEVNKNDYPLVSRHFSCSKDGFNITISRNATVPPLNLDAVWIPSGQGHCKPKNRSKDVVTFSFPFTDCGTQSMVNVQYINEPSGCIWLVRGYLWDQMVCLCLADSRWDYNLLGQRWGETSTERLCISWLSYPVRN